MPATSRREPNGTVGDTHAGPERGEQSDSHQAIEQSIPSAPPTSAVSPKTPDVEKDEIEPSTQSECALKSQIDDSTPRATNLDAGEDKVDEDVGEAVTPELETPPERPTGSRSNSEQYSIAANEQLRQEEARVAVAQQTARPQSQPVPVRLSFSTTRADRTASSPERWSTQSSATQLRPGSSGSTAFNASLAQSRDLSPAAKAQLRSPSPLKTTASADARRPSAVLERVRAMEAKGGTKE